MRIETGVYGKFTRSFITKTIQETPSRGGQIIFIIDVLDVEGGSIDLETCYCTLRTIYQEAAEIMLKLHKPLLDIQILLYPEYCQLTASPPKALGQCSSDVLPRRPSPQLAGHRFGQYKRVAIGGTFDHLHVGHKLMLSVAAMLTNSSLICGLTGDPMLASKKYGQLIQSLDARKCQVKEFLENFMPQSTWLEFTLLGDPFGPSIVDPEIEALVLSPETISAAKIINEKRLERGLKCLDIIAIDLISIVGVEGMVEDKLSKQLWRHLQNPTLIIDGEAVFLGARNRPWIFKSRFGSVSLAISTKDIVLRGWSAEEPNDVGVQFPEMVDLANTAILAASIIKFLNTQISNNPRNMSKEELEALQVAAHCIQNSFNVSEVLLKSGTVPDLSKLGDVKPSTAEDQNKIAAAKAEAEKIKNQGNAFLAERKAAEAVESYTRAIELDPENAIFYSNRAAAFMLQEDWSSAIEDSMAAISLNPRYAKAYSRLGAAYLGVNNHERAAEAYAKALEIEPENEQYKKCLDQAKRLSTKSNPTNTTTPGDSAAGSGAAPSGFGGLDFGSLLNNPDLMNMASRMMQNPDAMANLLNNPNIASMLQGFAPRSPPQPAKEEDN